MWLILKESSETRSISDTQQIGEAIDIWYSTNRRRDRYSILNRRRHNWYSILNRQRHNWYSILTELSEVWSIFDAQQTEARLISNTQGIVGDAFDTQQKEAQSTSNTQGIGDTIDIQYSTNLASGASAGWIDSILNGSETRSPYSTDGDATDSRYSTKQRWDWYLILNRWRHDRYSIHYCERKCWSDPLDTQGVGHVIYIWYSTDGDAVGSQGIVGDMINFWYSTILQAEALIGNTINTLQTETRSMSDTQRIIVGDAINIQFCLTEGKRLDDGQIIPQ